MEHGTIKRVEPGDPRQCHASIRGKRQCLNQSVEGCDFCIVHGGHHQQLKNERQAIYQIRASRMRARLQKQADHPNLLSLNEEIGVLRIMLEEKLNSIGDDAAALMMATPVITDLVTRIEKCVYAAERIENRRGQMMGKKELVSFALQLSEIASRYLDKEQIIKFMDEIELILQPEISHDSE